MWGFDVDEGGRRRGGAGGKDEDEDGAIEELLAYEMGKGLLDINLSLEILHTQMLWKLDCWDA